MQFRFVYSSVLTLVLVLTLPAQGLRDENPPVIVQSITQLLPALKSRFAELNRGDMLILDLDNTVFRETQMLGTDDWYEHAIGSLTEMGLSHHQANLKLAPINLKIKIATKMRVMDSGLPKCIRELQERGVFVLGLTARHPDLAAVTISKLAEIEIDFGRSRFPDQALQSPRLPGLGNAFLFKQGVAFTDGSPKGKVLRQLIELTGSSPKRVLAIDDRIRHVHSFTETLLEMKIASFVVHYLKAQEGKPFNPEIADYQLGKFLETGTIPSDEESEKYLCDQKLRR